MFLLKKGFFLLWVCIAVSYTASANAKLYIIVNKDNPMKSIGRDSLKRVYLGKIVSVPGLQKALYPVDLSARSAGRAEFLQKVMKMRASLLMQYRSRQIFSGKGRVPLNAGSQGGVESVVARKSNSIGYVSNPPTSSNVKTLLVL